MKLITKKSGQGGVMYVLNRIASTRSHLTHADLPAILLFLSLLLAACSSADLPGKNIPAFVASTSTPSSTRASTPGSQVDNLLYPITMPDARLGPLTTIRMLGQTHGWALTEHAILRTKDGGLHWRDVTPPTTQLNALARGDFRDSRYAWIVGTQSSGSIFLLHTSDGGQTWQRSTITTDSQSAIADMPHFLTPLEGWLELVTHGGPGAGSESADILHTTDSGQTWSKIASTDRFNESGLPRAGYKTGISFKDHLNGWATGHDASYNAWLYATHDGGHTWHSQPVVDLPGYYGTDATMVSYTTTPPVFFGNDGFLPVEVRGQLDRGPQAAVHGFILCITHDGGQTWVSDWKTMPFSLTVFTTSNLYIADMQHAWAGDDQVGALYTTSDGGQTWQQISSKAGPFKSLSFVDMSHGWAIDTTSSQLLHTSDGGRTWQPL
ncbi:MAG TPA: YCF48-related protein [Ktedonosporobacter sp.]|nr:YCF48-related protein [Ktedonosporobacter sp.]